jgi:hypothetical protein
MTGAKQAAKTRRTAPTTELRPQLRELAHRHGNDIDVSLFWRAADNSLLLLLVEVPTGVVFEVPVPAEQAMDAFHHPYAYLPVARPAADLEEQLAA